MPSLSKGGRIQLHPAAIHGQVAIREKKVQDSEGHVGEKNGPPTNFGDQNSAQRGAECRADRGHRSEESHGTPRLCFRNCLADKCHREGHHDRRSNALDRPRGNQHPERGRYAAKDRRDGEQTDSA